MAANEQDDIAKRLIVQEVNTAIREGEIAGMHNARYDGMLNAYKWLQRLSSSSLVAGSGITTDRRIDMTPIYRRGVHTGAQSRAL